VPCLPGNGFEKIEADRVIPIGRIEIDDIVGTPGRNMVKEVLGKIAMRIDDADPAAGLEVLDDEILQERGLARPCLSEAVGA
jgi:hypothetical protein